MSNADDDLDEALDELDEAINAGRRAVAACVDMHRIGDELDTLGVDLYTRFERTGDVADIDDAIEIGRRAVTAPAADDVTRAARLNLLGLALHSRAELATSVPGMLDEAVAVLRRSVAAAASTDENRPTYLANLADACRCRTFGRSTARCSPLSSSRSGWIGVTGPTSTPSSAISTSTSNGAMRRSDD